MRMLRRPLALSLAALGAGAVLTGCTAKEDPSHGSGSTSGHSSEQTKADAGRPSHDGEPSRGSDSEWSLSPLAQAWLDDDPSGTGPQMALRFLQALQDHDDLAADRQLYGWERMMLADRSLDYLHAVMNDVRRNADLDNAGRCRDAEWIDSDHVAVDCGTTQVVVRVHDETLATGVRISNWDGHDDSYAGSHSHAYTTFEL